MFKEFKLACLKSKSQSYKKGNLLNIQATKIIWGRPGAYIWKDKFYRTALDER